MVHRIDGETYFMICQGWDDDHIRRVRAILFGASIIILVLGAGWCAAFLAAGRPLLATLHIAMASSGALLLLLNFRGRLRLAAMIAAHLLPLFVGIFCLFDHVPPGLPRATHLHFLAVAAGCHFVFRQQGSYFRFVIPGLCLIAFLVFANTSLVIRDAALVIPPAAAWVGVWTNSVTALAGLVFTVIMMNADLTVRRMMEVEMRHAIANDDFSLHYQPQINEAGQVVGAEALIRWHHAEMGNIPPGKFIPLAEQTGLIVPIGNWVLRAACAQLALWEGNPETSKLTLAVNVSASQFRQPDFVHNVREIVRLSGARASHLKLELTESMFVDNIDATVTKMNALRDIGIVWSLDDFGTGYSSLSVLHRFPLGQIKIDQAFVRDMLSNKSNMVIIEAIIALARNLNLQVIAEGIETVDQLTRLREAGCLAYQGYLFSPPKDVRSFETYIKSNRPVPDAPAALQATG